MEQPTSDVGRMQTHSNRQLFSVGVFALCAPMLFWTRPALIQLDTAVRRCVLHSLAVFPPAHAGLL